ncbi:MAG: hypothetical protein KC877_01270 [Candidatus Kaiserbacteria bacterium]|nr:hypothetical protein [Candidatus Kaiserbacteria bacterium]MCB9816535.1 hypothetical protein [Candidatus Nomurabacteria bacterium]
MITVKAWWAGHRLKQLSIEESSLEETIEVLQQELNSGVLTITTCGVIMTPSTLCVDVIDVDKLVQQFNLNRR